MEVDGSGTMLFEVFFFLEALGLGGERGALVGFEEERGFLILVVGMARRVSGEVEPSSFELLKTGALLAKNIKATHSNKQKEKNIHRGGLNRVTV